jgi:hypothetical protein
LLKTLLCCRRSSNAPGHSDLQITDHSGSSASSGISTVTATVATIRQKVALLQSKRLYPVVGDVQELESYDYMVGMGLSGLSMLQLEAPSRMAHYFT